MADSKALHNRFRPQLVETTTKSRRGQLDVKSAETSSGSNPTRWLRPSELSQQSSSRPISAVPLEATKASTQLSGALAASSEPSTKLCGPSKEPSPRRFKPEPLETTKQSSRNRKLNGNEISSPNEKLPSTPKASETNKTPARRKFAPELIETSRRSRKSTDESTNLLPSDRTEVSPGDPDEYVWRRNRPISEKGSPSSGIDAVNRGSDEERVHRVTCSTYTRADGRQHSFRVPALEPIESSGSDKSNCPSLSTSPSAASESSVNFSKHAKKMRESCDDKSSAYLLQLAAKAAETQLRDQAMAAFPNDDFHEPVDHFAIDRESTDGSEESAGTSLPRLALGEDALNRRDSASGLESELEHMRDEQESALRQREQEVPSGNAAAMSPEQTIRRPLQQGEGATKQTPIQGADDAGGEPKHIIGGWQKGVGLQSMRNAASPPMLGQDLNFRMSRSPQATKLDVEQHPCTSSEGLERCPNGGGLWMGFCFAKDGVSSAPHPTPTGLQTPRLEKANPFESMNCDENQDEVGSQVLMTGQEAQLSSSSLSSSFYEDLDKEFPDAFVTQVYNYLSLGYPSLARKFDDELSKISRIPVDQLHGDDHRGDATGFVGLEESNGAQADAGNDRKCGRWQALRLYIREWARQHPEMTNDGLGFDAWGVRARRGSWAL
ncbi:MAG: hypothetical protein M1837_006524 [Sclerophora amabilis]|nr:MAG: hypothetical protein M1837_006524 [Sclerophora amabilis]